MLSAPWAATGSVKCWRHPHLEIDRLQAALSFIGLSRFRPGQWGRVFNAVWLALLLSAAGTVRADPAAVLSDALADIEAYQAEFSQTIRDQHGKLVQQSSGKMSAARPGRLRWETEQPFAQLIVVDGEQIWRYRRELPADLFQLHPTNRGVALYGDRVYLATVDAYLVALDAKTGEVAWEVEVEDYLSGYYMTIAPLAVEGRPPPPPERTMSFFTPENRRLATEIVGRYPKARSAMIPLLHLAQEQEKPLPLLSPS